jgi:hypothetical protein
MKKTESKKSRDTVPLSRPQQIANFNWAQVYSARQRVVQVTQDYAGRQCWHPVLPGCQSTASIILSFCIFGIRSPGRNLGLSFCGEWTLALSPHSTHH